MDKPKDPPADPAAVDPVPADAAAPAEAPAADSPPSEEGLPEWEPLTPELVEDEALRGDFMLRWAAVLIAVLLGCTEISDSLTLVRVRTGEYLASHGFLPPRTDVFSYTADERPWINLGWLSDHVQAAAYGVGGDAALSVLAAILAGIAFWLVVNAARTSVSTWWSAICAVLAVLAVFPLLRPGSDSFTILGLAGTMFLLTRTEERPDTRALWGMLPLFWLWSNLDPHAFLGIVVVIAYALGRMIGGDEEGVSPPAKRLWVVGGLACLVMLLHPFHWHVLESPWTAYGVIYPEFGEYAGAETEFAWLWQPLTERDFWNSLDVFNVAGLLAAMTALLAMVLNRNQLRWSHVLVWLAVNGLALLAGRQLAAAAIVNAVLAGVNGQDWYRAGFRQAYSVETAELIFSRGGRALTVIALFVLAYLGISGRLMGADGRRIGLGFDPDLRAIVDSYEDVLADSYDERPFNFLPEQGDVLIWIGQKPFIDSRFGLYARGTPNLAELHRELRPALRAPDETDLRTGNDELWQETFDEYEITHALPRLSGQNPDYLTFFGLLLDPEQDWALTRLGAATASLYRRDTQDRRLAEYIADHSGADFIETAFPANEEESAEFIASAGVMPRELTWYDRVLMLPQESTPSEVQLARHYNSIRSRLAGNLSLDVDLALSVLTIREARRGLLLDPNSASAWQALAASYFALAESDGLLRQQFNSGTPVALRQRQLISALYHAITCAPDDASTRMLLFEVLLQTGKPDLALTQLREVQRITGDLTTFPPGTEAATRQAEQNRELLTQLTTQIDAAREELNEELQSGTERLQVVQNALSRGLPGEALRLLEEDRTVVAQNATAQVLHAELLLDAGRIEEALTALESLSSMIAQAPGGAGSWRQVTALANIAAVNDDRARELWGDDARAATQSRLQSLLGFSPRLGEVPGLNSLPLTHAPREVADARPLTRAAVAGDLLLNYPPQWTLNQLCRAMTLLETGQHDLAADIFRQILEFDPETQYRPLVAFYLATVSQDAVDLLSPATLRRMGPPPPPSSQRSQSTR